MSSRTTRAGGRAPGPRLAASLIVRDEAANIGDCLRSLHGVVDEIHVHDTGSTDNTVDLALLGGAQVSRGPWTNDFAAARHAALAGWTADWVLTIDADERVIADPAALRRLLATTDADVLDLIIENREADRPPVRFRVGRLHRPAVATWQGRVHEQLLGRHRPARRSDARPAVIHLDHVGYAVPGSAARKGARNAELARAALADLAAAGDAADPATVARTMIDLGRSLQNTGEVQEALETYETVRELFPRTSAWSIATTYLTRLVMDHGMIDVALTLILQLRADGADKSYCDWLEAHCLVRLGHPETAQALLARVNAITDVGGFEFDPALLASFKNEVDDRVRARASVG
jgi:hypothetical protein